MQEHEWKERQMNPSMKRFVDRLQQSIEEWEETARYFEDPRVIGMEDINGSMKSGKELATMYRARADELRLLIKSLPS